MEGVGKLGSVKFTSTPSGVLGTSGRENTGKEGKGMAGKGKENP